MLIIILLLVAILIVLIGGPIALGTAVALPAWLVWSTGIIQAVFWIVVILVGMVALVALFFLVYGVIKGKLFQNKPKIISETPANTPPDSTHRVCKICGNTHVSSLRYCPNCEYEHDPAPSLSQFVRHTRK